MTANPLDRPPGLAPKGTSWGLGLMSAYAPGIPGLTAMAVSPWLPGGTDSGLPISAVGIGLWMIVALPLIIGMKSRRYWGVVLYFYVGLYCAVALPAALAVLTFLVLLPAHYRPPDFYYIFFGFGLLAMVPFWPMLVRALRLKYWQPWTTPDQWEIGDERIADGVFDATGAPRRPPVGANPARLPPSRSRTNRSQRRR